MSGTHRRMAEKMYEVYTSAGRGPRGAAVVERAFKEGDFKQHHFSIRALAEATMGRDWLESGEMDGGTVYLSEGFGGAVDHTAFSNLTTTVISGLMDDEAGEVDLNLGDTLARTVPTQYEQGEKTIAIQRVGREANRVIRPGESYGRYGLAEDWALKPDSEKRGGIVELTRETIQEDRTGQILEAARTVVDEARMGKNERLLRAILGIDNSIYMPQGTTEATYIADSSALIDPNRDNLATGRELIDYTDIEETLLMWADMRHRRTGRPIAIRPGRMQMLVMPFKLFTARQILNATEHTVGDETSAPAGRRRSANPLAQEQIELLHSNLAFELLTRSASDPYGPGGGLAASVARLYWYMGDFARAFEYRENWPLTAVTMGPGSYPEWDRDVVFGVKVSEKGVVAVNDPRAVIQIRG